MNILLVGGGPIDTWPDQIELYDYYIGVDRGSLHLLEIGRPVDAAIGDFDSLTPEELNQVAVQAKYLKQSPAEKDDTDTQLGILHAIEVDPKAEITMLGLTGGRIDHFLANIFIALEPRFKPYCMQMTMMDRTNHLRFFLPGEHKIHKVPEMNYLAFSCLTPVESLSLVDVKYPLHNHEIPYPITYASNEFIQDTASFSFESGVVLVIQSRDDSRKIVS